MLIIDVAPDDHSAVVIKMNNKAIVPKTLFERALTNLKSDNNTPIEK